MWLPGGSPLPYTALGRGIYRGWRSVWSGTSEAVPEVTKTSAEVITFKCCYSNNLPTIEIQQLV